MGQGAGVIGGMEIPPISEAITGFINGAKSVDPDFPVSSTYIGNFTDAAAASRMLTPAANGRLAALSAAASARTS